MDFSKLTHLSKKSVFHAFRQNYVERLSQDVQDHIVEVLVKTIFVKSPKIDVKYFDGFLSKINEDEFVVLEKALAPLLKRMPTIALPILCSLVKYVKIDFSEHLDFYLAILQEKLKSTNDSLRDTVVGLIANIAMKCNQCSKEKLARIALTSLKVAAPKWQIRMDGVRALRNVLLNLKGDLEFLIPDIILFLNKERHVDVRECAMKALKLCTQHISCVPESLVSFLKGGINVKKFDESALHMTVIVEVLSPETFSTFEDLAPKVLCLLEQCTQRASSNISSLRVVQVAARMYKLGCVCLGPVLKDVISCGDAAIYSTPLYGGEREYISLFPYVAVDCVSLFAETPVNWPQPFIRSIVVSLIQPMNNKKNPMHKCFGCLIRTLGESANSFQMSCLTSFFSLLDVFSEMKKKRISAIETFGEGTEKALKTLKNTLPRVPTAGRLRAALRSIVGEFFSNEILAMSLLIASHNLVKMGKNDRLRSRLVEKAAAFGVQISTIMIACETMDICVNKFLETPCVQAFFGFLVSLKVPSVVAWIGNNVVFPAGQILVDDKLLCASDSEINIFLTPEGKLYEGSKGMLSSKSSHQSKRQSEDAWAEDLKRKIRQKKGEDVDPNAEKLAKQAVIRNKLQNSINSVCNVCEALSNFSKEADISVGLVVGKFMPQLLRAIRFPLILPYVSKMLDALCEAVCDSPNSSRLLSIALRVGVLNHTDTTYCVCDSSIIEPERKPLVFYDSLLSDCLRNMNKCSLSPQILAVLVELFRIIASDNSFLNCLIEMFKIIEEFSDIPEVDDSFCCEDKCLRKLLLPMLEATLKGFAKAPRSSDPSPQDIIVDLCSGVELSNEELKLLLSNNGAMSPEPNVRRAVLEVFEEILDENESMCELKVDCNGQKRFILGNLWVLANDIVEDIAIQAEECLSTQESGTLSFCDFLPDLLTNPDVNIRTNVAQTIAALMKNNPEIQTNMGEQLINKFISNIPIIEKKREDEFSINEEIVDESELLRKLHSRLGVAHSLKIVAERSAVVGAQLPSIFAFIVEKGLSDLELMVRSEMLEAGSLFVANYGEMFSFMLAPAIEKALGNCKDETSWRREGAVVLLGSLTEFLAADDPRVPTTLNLLLDSTVTPSLSVQNAIGSCLSRLIKVPCNLSSIELYLNRMMNQLLDDKDEFSRKGAAFAVSGMIDGSVSALKKFSIVKRLEAGLESKSIESRQGALFGFQCLSERLGRKFEPYVHNILPSLLKCFSDPSEIVRKSANDAAATLFKNITPIGVKMLMVPLMKGAVDTQWRSRVASIRFLGNMAHCGSKHLAAQLSQVIPKLAAAASDANLKVQAAGREALYRVASVAACPEIKALTPVIIKSYADPVNSTLRALNCLTATRFMHSIDTASLELIVPIIQRGLRDRASDVKRKAAIIVGRIYALCSVTDVAEHLPTLLPPLKAILCDPLPETRSIVSKTFGQLVHDMDMAEMADIVEHMFVLLKSSGSTERVGGAQALSEIMANLNETSRIDLLDRLLDSHADVDATQQDREGVMSVLMFLPTSLGSLFPSVLESVLPVVVAGLSDDSQSVRDLALRSGKTIVSEFSLSHTSLLLPMLESCLRDSNWQIREGSIQLVGVMLCTIGGVRMIGSGGDSENDEGLGDIGTVDIICKKLGLEVASRFLSRVYILRHDVVFAIKTHALQVWKSVVAVSGAVLRKILPVLTNILLDELSSVENDQRVMAGSAMGDLVRKLQERMLPAVIPMLLACLNEEDSFRRQGSSLGLAEVIKATSNSQILEYQTELTNAVQKALCDSVADVRLAGGQAFKYLTRALGESAMQGILPALMKLLELGGEKQAAALHGLREIVSIAGRSFFQAVVPQLLESPAEETNIKTLGELASVAQECLHFYSNSIVSVFLRVLCAHQDGCVGLKPSPSMRHTVETSFGRIVAALASYGVPQFLTEVLKYLTHSEAVFRSESCGLMGIFFTNITQDWSDMIGPCIRDIVSRFNDSDNEVVYASWGAMKALVDHVTPAGMGVYLTDLRMAFKQVESEGRYRKGGVGEHGEFLLPGFNIPRGYEPFLAVFQHVLVHSSPELRRLATLALGEVISMTSAEHLSGQTTQIIGPLIRIMNDRFPTENKTAILKTINLIIDKGGAAIRTIVLQLQTTLVKALEDSSQVVRDQAAACLGKLMSIETKTQRVDPTIMKLSSNVSRMSGDIQVTMCAALKSVMRLCGPKVRPMFREKAFVALRPLVGSSNDSLRLEASKAFAACCNGMEHASMMKEHIWLTNDSSSVAEKLGFSTFVSALPVTCWKFCIDNMNFLVRSVMVMLESDDVTVQEECLVFLRNFCRMSCLQEDYEVATELFGQFRIVLMGLLGSKAMRKVVIETMLVFSSCCSNTMVNDQEMLRAFLDLVRDKSVTVKQAASNTLSNIFNLKNEPSLSELSTTLIVIEDGALRSALLDFSKKKLSGSISHGEEEKIQFEF
eukprot:TRINITY_DN2341_c0_g2_i1.p1 TRINITY_DN2341_c0_g2~~TRINITY_DN2341_c0_g2_i1.p1  ORF type:complete len:2457 (-),score=578.95 TRINITY_DN2341_c0_g2_i1:249-7619(-)